MARDLVVVLDASGSMAAGSGGTTRLEAARGAVQSVATELGSDPGSFTLMAYGHRLAKSDPGTCDDVEVLLRAAPLDPSDLAPVLEQLRPRGRTPLARALRRAGRALREGSNAGGAILLVTDGLETCGGDPVQVARDLRVSGIPVRIHVVGFSVTAAEGAELSAIATAGDGTYHRARDGTDLVEVLRESARVALVESTETRLGSRAVVDDRFGGADLPPGWSVRGPADDLRRLEDRALMVETAYGGPWDDTAKTTNLLVHELATDEPDVTASTTVDLHLTRQHQGVALLLLDDDGNHVELSYYAHPWGNNLRRSFQLARSVGGAVARVTRDGDIGAAPHPERLILRIERRGVEYRGLARFGPGEAEEIEIGSVTIPALGPLQIALRASNGRPRVPGTPVAFLACSLTMDEIERTRTAVPDDRDTWFSTEFRSADDFARDFRVHRPDPGGLAVERGLHLVTRSDPGPDGPANVAAMAKGLPEGDWTAEVQLGIRIRSPGTEAGLVVTTEDGERLWLGHWGKPWGNNVSRIARFRREAPDGVTVHQENAHRAGVPADDRTIVLRLERKGPRLVARQLGPDPTSGTMTWTDIGAHRLDSKPVELALFARNERPGLAPVTARVERLVVRRAPDQPAPR